ncbi:hypothetical protein Pan258_17910 [Symmachiella dynata]|uniref:sugar phosphate isomerase/epimerase family protein n=1 Tax=Symmachiella dynata TaxID=2527995 RepID=UPI00118AC2AA|nr:sugar phosphate isomerase/epimerase [Symmachiella dynata]QDT47755.1 hypothetical protein Pan258_17910 [Symmachiella dynata]
MFVAASTRCFSDRPFEDACEQLAELQYDKVELWLDETQDHLKPSHVIADPESFCARFRDVTRMTPIAINLENEVSLEDFQALVRVAQLFRLTQITIPASPLGTPFNAEIDRLRAHHRIASADGVHVSIKTKTGHLTEDPHTAVELCQATPGVGITLDPSYYICGPVPNQSYDQVFPYVFHTHLRDTLPDNLQVRIGLGEIDYSRIISQLQRNNYNLALSVEILPERLGDIDRAVEMRKMRLLLESLL